MSSDDTLKRAYDFYVTQGLAPHQAAAMAAHMMAESGGNTTAVHDGGTGYGVFGFRDPEPGKGRKTDLFNYARSGTGVELDPNDLETQLRFSLHELDTTEKAAGAKLYGARTYQDAVDAGVHYLRPQGYDPNNPAAAHNYAGRFNFGASLAGVQPMVGPAMAAAGGSSQPVTGGLLGVEAANSPDINVRTRFADQEIGQYSQMGQDPASQAALAKVTADKGLLSSGQAAALGAAGKDVVAANAPKRQEWQNLQASVHQPKELAPFPDFTQQLAQSRLKRKPWEVE